MHARLNTRLTALAIRALPLTLGLMLALNAGAQTRTITIDDAVRLSMAADARVQSSHWDALAASAKAEEARRRQLPSLSLSAGYTRLSDLQSSISLGPTTMTIDSLDNAFSLGATMQYPVFAGYRLRESAALAELQSRGKETSLAMVRRALDFETRRAYWEAVRSIYNVRMLQENRNLMQNNLEVVQHQLAQGTVINADLLAAQMRRDQADIDLGNARTMQQRAFLSLASLLSDGGDTSLAADPTTLFALGSAPDTTPELAGPGQPLADSIDANALAESALRRRPEIQASAIAIDVAEHSKKLAEAPLYPAVNLTGNYTLADPNQRVAFQTDPWKFTGTWSLGMSVSWDIGGIPANLLERQAQDYGIEKSRADKSRQEELIQLDVRACALTYDQTRRDAALVARMLDQAKENERVTEQRSKAGTASATDLLTAQIARLRSEFTIVNKQIDLQIAAADLCRAAALADLE